ncbi:MAG: hypothetical protein GY811_29155 [Myxococcales bacterium]|nr:hypothetical protein [Myxococcales bacterium]
MKLGEMLVRDGRLEQEVLNQIIEQQTREGGRIGSLLVAEQLISAETLTVYLGLEHGIPIATGATFERCKRSAVRLLTPEQAGRFRCIPIVIQEQTLIVAVDDPHDMQALDEISMATGYRVIPRVAPEIRIHYYLERFYGIPQPQRFAALPDMRGDASPETQDHSLPAPPLPGLPPQVAEPLAAPTPAPPIRTKRSSVPPPGIPTPNINPNAVPEHVDLADTEEHEALELDAADLVEELEADDEELAERAPQAKQSSDPVTGEATTEEEPPAAISCNEAVAIISSTKRRGDIADAMLAHAASVFDLATLLLVRDDMAFGWKGFGPGIDGDRIETLLMPLDPPSMLHAALESDEKLFRGRAFPSTLHSHWFRILRSGVPDFSVVVVCTIGKRVVNLLYGHKSDGADISDEEMDNLKLLMREASGAYVRLISKSKMEHRAATMNPAFGVASEGSGGSEGSDNSQQSQED